MPAPNPAKRGVVLVADPGKELRGFRVATTTNLGSKRGRGRGAFIDSVLTAVDGFYAEVLGSLRPWSAAPPKLRPGHPSPPTIDDTIPAALVSTDYSSQDEPPGYALTPVLPSSAVLLNVAHALVPIGSAVVTPLRMSWAKA